MLQKDTVEEQIIQSNRFLLVLCSAQSIFIDQHGLFSFFLSYVYLKHICTLHLTYSLRYQVL